MALHGRLGLLRVRTPARQLPVFCWVLGIHASVVKFHHVTFVSADYGGKRALLCVCCGIWLGCLKFWEEVRQNETPELGNYFS